jgi:hypothetical protein
VSFKVEVDWLLDEALLEDARVLIALGKPRAELRQEEADGLQKEALAISLRFLPDR